MLFVYVFMLVPQLSEQKPVNNIKVDSNIFYNKNDKLLYYMHGNELMSYGKDQGNVKNETLSKLDPTSPKVIFPVDGKLRVCEAANPSQCHDVKGSISNSQYEWKFKSDAISNIGIVTQNNIFMSVKSSNTTSYITKFRLNDTNVITTFPNIITEEENYLKNYDPKEVFSFNNKIYFIAYQKTDEGVAAAIAQVSDDESECYTDMVLPCGTTPVHQQTVQDVAVIRTTNISNQDVISVAALFQTDNGMQNICYYPIKDIEDNFVTIKRAEICAGKTNFTSLSKRQSFYGNNCSRAKLECSDYKNIDKCPEQCKMVSGRVNTSGIEDQLIRNNITLNITHINATSIAAIRLDNSSDIIYLGGHDGNLYKGYLIRDSGQFKIFHRTNLTNNQSINLLQFIADTNKILVIKTNTFNSALKEDNCSGQSWRSCLLEDGGSQSLCGWCTEASQCTVLSKCNAGNWKPGIKGISQYNLPPGSLIDLNRAQTETKAGVLLFGMGPKSGGTKLVINGTFFGNVSAEVLIGNTCRCNISEFTESIIRCTTESCSGTNLSLTLQYGGQVKIPLNLTFSYLPDPTIRGIFPNRTFKSGGANMSVIGTGFQAIQSPEIGISTMPSSFIPCHEDGRNNTFIACPAPTTKSADGSDSVHETVELKMDGVILHNPIEYTNDPVLKPFDHDPGSSAVKEFYPSTRFIIIQGERLRESARINDYCVFIGIEPCEIVISSSNDDQIKCYPPNDEPKKANESSQYPEVVAQVGNYKQHIGYLNYKDAIDKTLVIISVLLCCIIIVVICLIILLRYRKIQNSKKLKKEIEKTEIAMTEQCREAFVELHTDMTNVTETLVEHGIPFNQFFTYLFPLLFPQHSVKDMEKHPSLSELQEHEGSEEELTETMIKLDQLINNKFFIVSVIKTLDYQPRFKKLDRNDFASYLSLLLMKRMDLYTEIIEILITKLTHEEKDKKSRDLFRRCETISEKLIVNWLYICMFNPLKISSGPALFMLYKAIENLSMKWPTDAVTLKTRATLCQDNLLTANVDSEEIVIHVEMNNGRYKTDCRILDCDSISQVKCKCINAIYQREMGSEKPSLDSVDLEWQVAGSGKILYDEDLSSLIENGYRKLNTPKHYGITDGSTICLLSQEIHESDYGNLAMVSNKNPLLECEDTESTERVQAKDLQQLPVFHLIPPSESSDCRKMLELNFDRLLLTKINLKEYIDTILKNMFDIHNIPIPVRHLFHLLETCGLKDGFDKTIIESWKINSYFIKYWSKILSQPEVLYDLNECAKPHIQANMNVIVLAFIDSFSPPQTLGKKSPTSKLLFYKDCNYYRKIKTTFFKSGATVAGVKTDDLTSELSKLPSLIDAIPLNRRSMLYKLFQVIDNYDDQIIKDLNETEETKRLKLSEKFDEVFTTMRNT